MKHEFEIVSPLFRNRDLPPNIHEYRCDLCGLKYHLDTNKFTSIKEAIRIDDVDLFNCEHRG